MSTTGLFTLGKLYISDFLKEGEKGQRYELSLEMDKDGAVKLPEHIPINKMFGKYWYRSGINESMRRDLKDIVDSIISIKKPRPVFNYWLDIASNDGTLLSFVPDNYIKVGIDPCEDSFQDEAWRNADFIIQDYFSIEALVHAGLNIKFDVITSIAVFYDIVNRGKFLDDVYSILSDDGIWVLQQSYTPLMLQQLAFDNICHEHYYYYSLFNIKKLLERHGFKIFDCQLNTVNGGSFRLYVGKNNTFEQPYKDVCDYRVNSILEYEKTLKVDAPITWMQFYIDVLQLGKELKQKLTELKAQGKSIWGYGASTKGNTLLQFFDINTIYLDAIADRSEYKWGRMTVGTNIPIKSEAEMRAAHPDYLLVLPWHFITEFKEREKEYLSKGGHFIVPCPKLTII